MKEIFLYSNCLSEIQELSRETNCLYNFSYKYLSFNRNLTKHTRRYHQMAGNKEEKKKTSTETDPQLNKTLELQDMDFEIIATNKFEKIDARMEIFSREMKSISQM